MPYYHEHVPLYQHQTETSQKVPLLIPTPQNPPPARSQHQSKIIQRHHHHKTLTNRLRNHSHTIHFHQYCLHYHCRYNHPDHYTNHQHHPPNTPINATTTTNTSTQTNIPIPTLMQLNIPIPPRFHAPSTSIKPYPCDPPSHLPSYFPRLCRISSGWDSEGLPYHSRDNNQTRSPSLGASEDTPSSRNKHQTSISKTLRTTTKLKTLKVIITKEIYTIHSAFRTA